VDLKKAKMAELDDNLENIEEPEAIDPAHLSAVLEGLAQALRREFATPEEIAAAFRRFVEDSPRND
jgi:hypothetical protein